MLILELLSTPLALLSPIGLKIAVDNVVGGKPLPAILRELLPIGVQHSPSFLLITAVAIQMAIVLVMQGHWFASYMLKIRSGEKILLNFRSRLFHHLQRLPVNYHHEHGSADSTYRVQDDAAALRSLALDGSLFLVSDIFKLSALMLVTLEINLRLGLAALCVAPFLIVYAAVYQWRVGGRHKEVKNLDSSSFRVVQEALSTIRAVKICVQEAAEETRFRGRALQASGARMHLAYADGVFGVAVNVTTACGVALVLYVGMRNVLAGALSLGTLLLVITYLVQLYAPLQNITYHLASLKTSAAGVERALDVFGAEAESQDSSVTIHKPIRRATGRIEFQSVTFAYPGKRPLLENFCCNVPAGARVGLVGRTGAGKTTLVNLLVRFIQPISGRILLDGQDMQVLSLAELRRQFAFVLQETVLFSTSIAQNIAYARPDATRADIEEAARAARAHEFIERLPEGYDTQVGEQGLLLSGGERQRIALARAFLQDAPILVMDEPTSSLDVATEAEILSAMERLRNGRTCFIISHRLNAVSDCDLIFHLRHGEPLEVSAGSAAWKSRSAAEAETDADSEAEPRVHLA